MTNCYEIIDLRCDRREALEFNSESRLGIGHLLSLSFTDGTQLVKDTKVSNPENPNETVNIVAAFEFVGWEGYDVIQLNGHLSPQNKAMMQEALATTSKPILALEFVVYEYDYHAKKYFQNFTTDKKSVKFGITENTRVYISNEPDRVLKTPILFQFSMSLTALPEDQEVCFSTSASGRTHKLKLVKKSI